MKAEALSLIYNHSGYSAPRFESKGHHYEIMEQPNFV